jgi:hypothetical protein
MLDPLSDLPRSRRDAMGRLLAVALLADVRAA